MLKLGKSITKWLTKDGCWIPPGGSKILLLGKARFHDEFLRKEYAELKEESSHSSRSQREYSRCQASFPHFNKRIYFFFFHLFISKYSTHWGFFFLSISFGQKKIRMVQKNESHSSRSGQEPGRTNLLIMILHRQKHLLREIFISTNMGRYVCCWEKVL